MDNGELAEVEKVKNRAQRMEDDIKKLGLAVKRHEVFLEFLNTQRDIVDKSILDMQVKLTELRSSSLDDQNRSLSPEDSEKESTESILQQENSAASMICHIKTRYGRHASNLPATKDAIGVVASLGKVNDDKLSRVFSEYLGLETMLAIVCKTYEGVRALERYDDEGSIEKSSGVHGLGRLVAGRPVKGRFLVFAIDRLRPYDGDLVSQDPQKRLALLNPRLPNGKPPSGFIGFAINMIDIDTAHLSSLTSSGHGLRETLFYSLFSRLQVYKTRSDMFRAMPFISDGAVSMDGGIIKSDGVYYLGQQEDVAVRFPVRVESSLTSDILEVEEQIKLSNWKIEFLIQDILKEENLLDNVKKSLNIQTEVYSNYIQEVKHVIHMMQNGGSTAAQEHPRSFVKTELSDG